MRKKWLLFVGLLSLKSAYGEAGSVSKVSMKRDQYERKVGANSKRKVSAYSSEPMMRDMSVEESKVPELEETRKVSSVGSVSKVPMKRDQYRRKVGASSKRKVSAYSSEPMMRDMSVEESKVPELEETRKVSSVGSVSKVPMKRDQYRRKVGASSKRKVSAYSSEPMMRDTSVEESKVPELEEIRKVSSVGSVSKVPMKRDQYRRKVGASSKRKVSAYSSEPMMRDMSVEESKTKR